MTPLQARWVRRANIPPRFLDSTLDSLSPYAEHDVLMSVIRGWIDDVVAGHVIRSVGSPRCGKGLLLTGQPGAGKSRLAATILQEIARRATKTTWNSLMMPTTPLWYCLYPEILLKFTDSYDGDPDARHLVDRLFGTCEDEDAIRVLVLDDLGKEHRSGSGWSQNIFDHLLRIRFDKGFPTIVTSNVMRHLWASQYGVSMDSFADEALTPLAVISEGGDRRR